MDLVVVGGVPGAGKSTVLRAYAATPDVTVLDPDAWRERLRWRPLLHVFHLLLVWMAVLIGPERVGTLLVHDTATRPRRRGALLALARWRGWRTSLVLVDVSRETALAGQVARGRVAPPAAFERHWARWCRLRTAPETAGTAVVVVSREQAAAAVSAVVGAPQVPGGSMLMCSRPPVDSCC